MKITNRAHSRFRLLDLRPIRWKDQRKYRNQQASTGRSESLQAVKVQMSSNDCVCGDGLTPPKRTCLKQRVDTRLQHDSI